mgnify:FL=1
MQPYFDPLVTAYKSITGAVQQNSTLNMFVAASDDYNEAFLVLESDGGGEKAYPMEKSAGGFFVPIKAEERGLFFYFFIINGERYGASENLKLAKGSLKNFQLSVYAEDFTTPEFLKGGLIYQIFPDRFCKVGEKPIKNGKIKRYDWGGMPTYKNEKGEVLNNEFFGGNFDGIRSKTDYLKSLGVTTVYLNPISEAYSSHRYDTGDYLTPDMQLGTEKELKEMLSELKKAGIKAIFDGVYNHTGADSLYFNKYGTYSSCGAYNSPSSPYLSWYYFNNYPEDYESWWGFKSLPKLNPYSGFRKFVLNEVIPKYMRLGFSGVRLDVVDEIPDEFVKDIRAAVKNEDEDGAVIGEVWEDATNKIAYGVRRKYFLGKELDSVMNYPLKNAIIDFLLHADSTSFVKVAREQINNYPKASLDVLMNVLSTHDTSRLITVLGRSRVIVDKDLMKDETLDEEEYAKGKNLAKIAYVLAYTAYGVPSLYYGDEAGVYGDLDPYNRLCYPWGKEDKELLEFFRKLGEIRKNEVFKTGTFRFIHTDEKVVIFERKFKNKSVVIAASRENADVKLKFSRPLKPMLSGGEKSETHVLKSDSAEIYFE